MGNSIVATIVLLLLIAGSVWLQIVLSKMKNRWLGLIIPLICFMFSLLRTISVPMYFTVETSSVTESIDGVEISEETTQVQSDKSSIGSMLVTVVPIFLVSNISTFIFLAIYFASREKRKLRNQLDIMNIQDLE
jgi:hypothetical protein